MSRTIVGTMHVLQQETLEVDGPTFVEPEMGPVGARGEVTGPGMAEFVQQDVGQASIAANERRGQGGQIGVLHASVGERGRKNDRVVAGPRVRRDDLFCVFKEAFCVGLKLPLDSIGVGWLGPDTGTLAELAELEITTDNGDEVRGNADGLLKVVGAGLVGLGVVLEGGHEDGDGRVDGGSVGDLVRRRVDARHEGAAVNGLALRVEERVGLAGGLLLGEPSEGGAVVGGGVVDVDVNLVALFVDGRRDGDLERRTEGTTLCAQAVVDFVALDVDRVDLEVACVQSDGGKTGLNKFDDVSDTAGDGACLPVNAPVEMQVNGLVVCHLGVSVDVLGHAQSGSTHGGRVGWRPSHGCKACSSDVPRGSAWVVGGTARCWRANARAGS